MRTFTDYRAAFAVALTDANKYGKPMALRRMKEYGREMFEVSFAVGDPAKRFGVDAQAQIVEPEVKAVAP